MSTHPEGCECRTCRVLESLKRGEPSSSPRVGPAVTAKELEKHAKRFGPALVEETAAELGIRVKVEKERTTRTRTKGPTLKQRVAAHLAEGRDAELIAELENLSPSRARRLIEEVST